MIRGLLGLAPVASFLAVLVLLDSYKLVRLRVVLVTVLAGLAMAGASWLLADALLRIFPLERHTFTRYVAPITEELLKAAVILALIRMHRIGFLVDAAILGFAVGAGFALGETVHYLRVAGEAGLGTWLARGFGTAIMHGGATAIFAVMGLAMLERSGRARWQSFLPGLLLAALLHSAYNHFFFSPFASALGVAVVLPLLLGAVFTRSEAAIGEWLGKGFDADAEMLSMIESGRLTDAPVGRYLHELKSKFAGPVVADLLCYVRLHTELALRAKGILMMRETGFDVPVDEATREKFAELGYLEKSIGRTGRLAIQPMLHMSHKDLWQLYMLGK
ncbi:MAG TPA: PrsW family glutamic-type intramembrane protease [Usitatibacter sp.]|nr:PrsW family glutamic-type intramembrane protease [Usitatibacter sp.]